MQLSAVQLRTKPEYGRYSPNKKDEEKRRSKPRTARFSLRRRWLVGASQLGQLQQRILGFLRILYPDAGRPTGGRKGNFPLSGIMVTSFLLFSLSSRERFFCPQVKTRGLSPLSTTRTELLLMHDQIHSIPTIYRISSRQTKGTSLDRRFVRRIEGGSQ